MHSKTILPLSFLFVFSLFCVRILAQTPNLPSLFGDENGNSYLKNSVLKPGEDPVEKIHDLIFIKTTVSSKTCYVGEPLLVTYQLYTSVSCHSRITKQEPFTGCSVIEMTTDEPEDVKKENGKTYRVQLIRRVQLIPLRAGSLTIPPSTVNNEVGFSTVDNPYRSTTYSADVSSAPVPVQVKALPPNEPANFNGITGTFLISATTDSTTIAAGENNILHVTISGSGNIEAVGEPNIKWPKNIEHFEAVDSQQIDRMNFPEKGDKTFSFPFIATKKGKLTIPEISFSFFNPNEGTFETVTTKAISLQVTPRVKNEKPVVEDANDLSNQKYLWLVPSIAAAVVLMWLIINRNQKKTTPVPAPVVPAETAKETKPEEPPVKPDYELLLMALSEAEDNGTFYTNAKTLLLSSIQYKLSPKQENETILLNLVQTRNTALAQQAEDIISVCNQELYSPVEDNAARTMIVDQLSRFIQQLEEI